MIKIRAVIDAERGRFPTPAKAGMAGVMQVRSHVGTDEQQVHRWHSVPTHEFTELRKHICSLLQNRVYLLQQRTQTRKIPGRQIQ